jgi:transcriptional regulator with XRE-family HTH domain
MESKNWLQKKIEKFADDPAFLTEQQILKFTEAMVRKMEENTISRAELARMLGVSKAMVTKLLRGNPNMTMKTMVTLAHSLGCELDVDIHPRGFRRPGLFICETETYTEPVSAFDLGAVERDPEVSNAAAA